MAQSRLRRKRTYPPKAGKLYRSLWRTIDGAVRDALAQHPEYLAPNVREKTVRNSINKRAVGALMSYATRGVDPAAETGGCCSLTVVVAGVPNALPQRRRSFQAGAAFISTKEIFMRQIATVVLSGGQDSTTCLGYALAKYGPDNVRAVSFDYGQKHRVELTAAERVVEHFEIAYSDPEAGVLLTIPHEIVTLGPIFAGRSPLTNGAEALETYGSAEEMDAIIGDRVEKTFVPMRNAVFLMMAANRAICADSYTLVTGVCEADNANYPDCRQDFIDAAQDTINEALGTNASAAHSAREHGRDSRAWGEAAKTAFVIDTPLIALTKAQSIELALRTPHTYAALAYSHTAYDGRTVPDGLDHASVLRADGFAKANVPDPLVMRAVAARLMRTPLSSNYDCVRLTDFGSPLTPNYREWDAEAFARAWR